MGSVSTTGAPSVANLQASIKQFFSRGGFVNGLNPAVVGRIWYVNGNTEADADERRGIGVGSDSNTGLAPTSPFLTMSRVLEFVDSYDIISLAGLVREQVVAPEGVYDVTIMGAGNTPRQATDGGVFTGGGATWMAPATGAVATTPLLEVVRQGWKLGNILFNPHTNSAAVRLTTAGGLDEAGQFAFVGNTVLGGGTGQIGVEDNGGSGFVVINGNIFQLLTGTAVLGLNTANAIPLSWMIAQNRFQQNTNDVKMSLSYGQILWNQFMTAGSGATNKVISTKAVSGQGGNNLVSHNNFNNTAAQVANASGFDAGTGDAWTDNYCTDAVDYGVPA